MKVLGGLAANLPREVWNDLLGKGTRRHFATGQLLMYQNARVDHCFALLAGRVKVARFDEEGRELVLGVRGPGELLGEMGLLWRGYRSASITAIEPCETYVITGGRFLEIVRSRRLETEILRHVISRLLDDEHLRSETSVRPASLRVARGLLHMADRALQGMASEDIAEGVDIGLNQSELASALGLSRQTIAYELAKLRRDDVVTTRSRRVVILRVDELRTRRSRRVEVT
jgi:CRP/FNR family transcriptional regulator, cyclic AMP receptor protein